MNNKNKLINQIKAMEDHYFHSMDIYHTVLSEKFEEIDQSKAYSTNEIKDFFSRNSDLYETWWLDWYLEAIWALKSFVDKMD